MAATAALPEAPREGSPTPAPLQGPPVPRGPYRLALCMTLVTSVLVAMGALVTSTDSGMAFADWPLSDGELMPERSLTTLDGFLEHFHRVVATAVGLMAIGVVVWAYRSPTVGKGARLAAILGLVLCIVQGVVGGVGVHLELPVVTSAAHGTLAQITWATFAVTTYLLSQRYRDTAQQVLPAAGGVRKATAIAVALLIAQTVLGAIARHSRSGGEHALWTHVGNAFVVFLVLLIATGVANRCRSVPGVRGLANWITGLLLLQILLGFVALLVRRGKHPENIEYLWRASLISSHVLIGAMLTVLTVLLAAHVRRGTWKPGAEGAGV